MSSSHSHSQSGQQHHESTGATFAQGSSSSYRDNRRLQQSEKTNGVIKYEFTIKCQSENPSTHQQLEYTEKKTRGRTRGVKWQKERKRTLGVKPSCQITKDMKKIVGDNADQFITEVGHWLRNMLPLQCRRWKYMDSTDKQRLLDKINAEWTLPHGDNVKRVIENQCKALYRQWRYRLKEQFFDGYSTADALKNCPEDVDPIDWKWIVEKYWGSEKQKRISQVNRSNRSKQMVKAVQGSKSTARILESLRKNRNHAVTSQSSEQDTHNGEESNVANQEATEGESEIRLPSIPEYITLWEMTKRHKDKSMDKIAEEKLEEFQKLHEEQIELYGDDSLTVEEAYMRVLGTSTDYINGLEYEPKPPKAMRYRKPDYEETEPFVHQMGQQFEQLERTSREREIQLNDVIQVLKDDKVAMLEEIEKMKQDAKEREERMRAEFLVMMQEQLRAFSSGQEHLHK